MRSVSKSFVGLLAGIAIGEDAINPSAPVLDYFPELVDLRNPERNAINVEHLLTMSSGLHWEETLATYGGFANDETHLYWAWNPDRLVLSRALDAPPGTRFVLSCRSLASMCPACWCGERRWLRWFPRREF
jgi:CubicO group peptidase (beta-lactamase class C family)